MTWRWSETGVPYRLSAALALALLTAACGEDSKPDAAGPQPMGDGEALTTYEPCPIEEDLGEFIVELASDYTSVRGKVGDRVNPETLTLEVAREGDCRLITPPRRLCNPLCNGSTESCAEDVCVPVPQGLDLGSVSVAGLSRPISMTPNPTTKGYNAAPPPSHPGFEPGATLTLTATGGEYDPITLRGWGISLFELSDPVRVDPGMPTALRWTAPEDPGPARVSVNLNINLHGSNRAWIECDFPDTGAAEIPAGLIDALIAQGLTGNPTIEVTRRTASSVQIEPGCVEFLVMSFVSDAVTVPGIVSCDQDTPCPEGMTCLAVEQLCE